MITHENEPSEATFWNQRRYDLLILCLKYNLTVSELTLQISSRDGITCHILDTTNGRPASNVSTSLFIRTSDGSYAPLGNSTTDKDGRISSWTRSSDSIVSLSDPLPESGVYKIIFSTQAYFASMNLDSFFPQVEIVFQADSGQHYHLPLLLSRYSYTTYRGS